MNSTITAKINTILNSSNPITIHRLTNTKYRVGFCSRCGGCCSEINIDTLASDNVVDWLTGYGITCTIKSPMFSSPDSPKAEPHSISMSIPIICTHLHYNTDGTTYCDRHDNLPSICAAYPKSPSKHPKCTYLFFTTDQLVEFFKLVSKWEDTHRQTKQVINM